MTHQTNTAGLVGTLSFTGSLQELAQLLNSAASAGLLSAGAVVAAPSSPPVKATSAKAADKTTASTTEKPAETPKTQADTPATDAAIDAPAITYDQVSTTTLKLVGEKGKPAAVALFEQFGVANARALTEAQWPEFVAAAEAALAA